MADCYARTAELLSVKAATLSAASEGAGGGSDDGGAALALLGAAAAAHERAIGTLGALCAADSRELCAQRLLLGVCRQQLGQGALALAELRRAEAGARARADALELRCARGGSAAQRSELAEVRALLAELRERAAECEAERGRLADALLGRAGGRPGP